MNAAEAWSHACDVAQDDDRRWFLAHPDRSYRIRPMVPGEHPGVPSPAWCAVHQLRPGWRLRMLGGRGHAPLDTEQAGRYWFDRAVARDGAQKAVESLRYAGAH
jgi:hypothetical protein